jgi:hypothetical protein
LYFGISVDGKVTKVNMSDMAKGGLGKFPAAYTIIFIFRDCAC